MSLQRAVVNCRECFEVMKKYDSRNLQGRGYCHKARNEAMKALEDHRIYLKSEDGRSERVIKEDKISFSALETCMNCDYSSPKIVDMLKQGGTQ